MSFTKVNKADNCLWYSVVFLSICQPLFYPSHYINSYLFLHVITLTTSCSCHQRLFLHHLFNIVLLCVVNDFSLLLDMFWSLTTCFSVCILFWYFLLWKLFFFCFFYVAFIKCSLHQKHIFILSPLLLSLTPFEASSTFIWISFLKKPVAYFYNNKNPHQKIHYFCIMPLFM